MRPLLWEGGELRYWALGLSLFTTSLSLISFYPDPPHPHHPYTLSMTNLFIIGLICVKTCVYKASGFASAPFTLRSAKTTRNTPHSSAAFSCIPMGPNRWHLLIENRWSRLYAAWSAAPLPPDPLRRLDRRYMFSLRFFFILRGSVRGRNLHVSEAKERWCYEELRL